VESFSINPGIRIVKFQSELNLHSFCSLELPNPEECDATDDDSNTTAGLIIMLNVKR